MNVPLIAALSVKSYWHTAPRGNLIVARRYWPSPRRRRPTATASGSSVAEGSIAADRCPPKTALCLQCSDSDQILPRSAMSRRSIASFRARVWTTDSRAEVDSADHQLLVVVALSGTADGHATAPPVHYRPRFCALVRLRRRPPARVDGFVTGVREPLHKIRLGPTTSYRAGL